MGSNLVRESHAFLKCFMVQFLKILLDVSMIFFFCLQVAFKTGNYKQQVIFIGGLTDGLLATEYAYIFILKLLILLIY